MRNAGLEEVQAGIKIAGRNINNLRYANDITLLAEGLLRVPWRLSRRSKQSILKEISPGISMKGIMLKLKLQYFGQRIDAKELMLLNWPRIDPVLWPSHVKS